MFNTLRIPDPAVDTEFRVVVPGGQVWRVVGVTATLTNHTAVNLLNGQPAVDYSGNARDGVYGAGLNQGPVPGLAATDDTAIALGGITPPGTSTGRVDANVAAMSSAGSFSVECWVSWDVYASLLLVFGNGAVFAGSTVYALSDGGIVGGLTFQRQDNTFTTMTVGGATPIPTDGLAHHIVGTWDNATGRLDVYLDGVNVGTGVFAVLPPVDALGFNRLSLSFASGGETSADELAFYNTRLSPARVAAHYAARGTLAGYSAAVLADAPSAYYHLDEGGTLAQSQVVLAFGDGSRTLFVAPPLGTVASPIPHTFSWLAELDVSLLDNAAAAFLTSIPAFNLPAGYTITSQTLGDQSGFQWSDVTVWYDFQYESGYQIPLDWNAILFL